jgi:SAM-dependent methyltransferase
MSPSPAEPARRETLEDYLASFDAFASSAEARAYLGQHLTRLLATLERIPDRGGKLLEIGASPYCMTLLVRRERKLDISLVNYGSEGSVALASGRYGEAFTFPCAGTNVECEPLPYADATFDVVLCAEVLEHLTFDPAYMLGEIRRVLRPGGRLVLTTPNVLRWFLRYRNARALARGANAYGPYSGYGPYGRHNREFTPDEVRALLEGCGFSVLDLEVVDLEGRPRGASVRARLGALLEALFPVALALMFRVRPRTLRAIRGEQIMVTAVPGNSRAVQRSPGLYVSQHALEQARAIFPRIP